MFFFQINNRKNEGELSWAYPKDSLIEKVVEHEKARGS